MAASWDRVKVLGAASRWQRRPQLADLRLLKSVEFYEIFGNNDNRWGSSTGLFRGSISMANAATGCEPLAPEIRGNQEIT